MSFILRVGKVHMATMKYVDITASGVAEHMFVKHGAIPRCCANDVLVKVIACGVNRPDVLQRMGLYAPPPNASPILGLEVAGEVIAVGKDVTSWSVGDRVCALCNGGGYAEFVAVPAGQCLPIPEGLSAVEAASLPETFFTVWSNVFQRAQLRQGESLLVHGGTSGIGVAAIQLCNAMGARVFATARSAEKSATCEMLGAERAVDTSRQDFVTQIMTLTQGHGVDVILDMVGGTYLQKNIACAAEDARVVSIACLEGSRTEVDLMQIIRKRLMLTGSLLRPQSADTKALIASQLKQQVWPLLVSRRIVPRIDTVFCLADVVEAHRLMESGQHVGKIVLEVCSD